MNRRDFLSLAAAAGTYAALPSSAASPQITAGSLRFVFFTDTHLQPELKGDEGTALAMRRIRALKPEFCLQGGDHCYDINAVPRDRSNMLLDLYTKTSQQLDGIPVHHALGNHDVFGRDPHSGVPSSDPLYGKKAFEQRFDTRTYYSFARKGYHFIVLDSVGLAPNGGYQGLVDPAQLSWLAADLKAQAPGTPIVVVTHIPLVTSVAQYDPAPKPPNSGPSGWTVSNAHDVLALLEGHRIIAVLQGHTHINETVYWRDTPYITSGAVCGNWWKGPRWGTPEGFTVVELSGGQAHWRYEPYGWRSVAPEHDPYPSIAQPRHG